MAPKNRLHPETRTVRKLEADGWDLVGKVATRMGRFSVDLFGFADVIGLRDGGVILVQATSDDHVSHRVRKMESPELIDRVRTACKIGVCVEVWGWYKHKEEPRIVSFNEKLGL